MAEEETPSEEPEKKKSKMPLILGAVLGLAGAGGGFFAVSSGMILAPETEEQAEAEAAIDASMMPDVAFVPVEPLVISLRAPSQSQHLRFRAELEVPTAFQAEVEKLLPRVVDVLNSYLRALDPGDLEDATALTRLRAQMLRRVQTVAGQDRVNDLLVMEFVLN
ncbi:flagellar basal body-associated FliL family protein [Sulfitobacter sp. S0837]|uniref:flagellar basal body-associated FliL family protein n=1 Tax=Sulfitobacter maritimus TaxID=2741719 RepID=UPI001584365F|nr:flagellar basal body-associated FliL family protein [Sulfitobacter maritimus]NUH66771.1 flagellar basal body-associated FliL family protein [Sulfitobacter maritimus]